MKKILSTILTFALILSTVLLNAQGITISREEFINTSAQIDAILAKEFNNYTIKNPEAAYKEFREILQWKSKQYDPNQAKTYRDKQTYRNRAFMPSISQKEKYPNSTYFKKEGDFYRYAIAARNASLETSTPLGYQDFQNHAENEMRRMFLQESKDENVLKEINLDNKRSPINDASYLAGYYSQNLAFTEAVREANLTLHSSDCQSPESKKDKDCINAEILGQYNYKLFESANQNVIKHISTIAPMMDRCLSKVLAPLQARKIALQEIEEYLDEHSNLPWESCGVNYEEARNLILSNTLTREEAEDMIGNIGFGERLLKSLDYISFSYYVNRASAIQDFKMGIEDGLEDMSNSEIYREAQISDILSNSLNKVLTQIASNYIAYGQVFYYDVEGFSGKSDKFAETWSKVGTNELYQNMPIAKLARDAITKSGRRGYQDKNLAKSMQEVRFESNAKTEVEILAIASDFVMDPTMLLAPIGETVKGLKLASKVAQTAPKTTAKVTKAAETVGRGVQTAKNALTDSKVGRSVQRATQPVKQLKSKAGNFVSDAFDAFDDFSGMGRHLDDAKTAPKTTQGLTKGAETTTDVVEDFAKAPTPKPEPVTALPPKKLETKLTGEFDDLVASAKPEETRRGIGFKPQDNVSPSNTTTGAPEGMRRQIGFGKSDTYIPDDAGKAVNGKGGVQDFTAKGNTGPQARGPEGPNAKNPYDVRNSAGGPDTPGTPQQNLSDLNRQITNEPTLTKQEADDLFKQRQSRYENLDDMLKREGKNWISLDKEFHETVKVELIDPTNGGLFTKITKADGSTKIVETERLHGWLAGGMPDKGIYLSKKERDAIQGYKDIFRWETDFMSEHRATIISKELSSSSRYSEDIKSAAENWIALDKDFHGTVKVERAPGNKVRIVKTKPDGSGYYESKYMSESDFKSWINGVSDVRGCGISRTEKDAIQGLDDLLNTTPTKQGIGFNQRISNTPKQPTLTFEESKKLNRGRDSQAYRISGDKENYSQSTRFKASDFRKLDKQYTGTSQVTWIDDEYVEITKLNGEKFKAKATSFRAWLDGVPEVPELNISQKERDAIKGLDDFMTRNNVTVAKTQEIAQQAAKKAELQKKYSAMVDSYENMLYRVQPKSASQRLKDEFRRMANGGRPHPKRLKRLGLEQDVIDDIVQQDNNIRAIQSEIRKFGKGSIDNVAKQGQKAVETPTAMATKPLSSKQTLTQTDADNLFLERQNRYQNLSYSDRKEARNWILLDEQFHGTVDVEFDYHDSFFVTITKADGSTQKVMGSDFYAWLYGSGFRELALSEKEIEAMGKEIHKFARFMESDLRKF